jgi:hypothetical protein
MGRPEKSIDSLLGLDPPARLAQGLRDLRRSAGPLPYRVMAARAGVAPSTLSKAAAGDRLPSWNVVRGFVESCGADPREWWDRWCDAGGTHPTYGPREPVRDTPRPPGRHALSPRTRADTPLSPDPLDVTTPAAYMRALRALKAWADLSLREISANSAITSKSGPMLPRTTIADVLKRDALPRRDFVRAFVTACHGTEADVHRWDESWQAINASEHHLTGLDKNTDLSTPARVMPARPAAVTVTHPVIHRDLPVPARPEPRIHTPRLPAADPAPYRLEPRPLGNSVYKRSIDQLVHYAHALESRGLAREATLMLERAEAYCSTTQLVQLVLGLRAAGHGNQAIRVLECAERNRSTAQLVVLVTQLATTYPGAAAHLLKVAARLRSVPHLVELTAALQAQARPDDVALVLAAAAQRPAIEIVLEVIETYRSFGRLDYVDALLETAALRPARDVVQLIEALRAIAHPYDASLVASHAARRPLVHVTQLVEALRTAEHHQDAEAILSVTPRLAAILTATAHGRSGGINKIRWSKARPGQALVSAWREIARTLGLQDTPIPAPSLYERRLSITR